MMKSLRGVSIALFALLTLAPVCLAADEPTPTPAADTTQATTPATTPETPAPAPVVAPTPAPAAAAPTPPPDAPKYGIPGQGSLGGSIGLSRFHADADYTHTRDGGGTGRDLWSTRDAAMRFAFASSIRYTWSNRMRWQVSPGFVWTGYKENSRAPFKTAYFPNDSLKDEYLTLVMPITAQVQLLHRTRTWLWHVGAGGGAYRVTVEQGRHVVQDPVTKRLHRGFYPGATAEIGAERFLKSLQSVSLEFTATSHLVFAERDEQFPSGFNSNIWSSEVRFGANYYFDPSANRKPRTALP